FATEAAKVLGMTADQDWMHVASNIPILKMDNGVTREHATYSGEGIKQADVNLLSYPLKQITDVAQIKKDLEYYETRVPNEGTPAMTQAVFTTLYARLGNADKAYRWFKESYIPNLNPPFRVIAETKGGTNPYFATGAGGIIQSLLMGFGGLDITSTGIVQLKTSLPKQWKSLTLTGVGPQKKTFSIK
ncbi:MAG TPA: glycoside hydrolase family 65 protein, partial [Chitinophagaceae bacterium]|nr:glycoside hydrolase family 65 protein [Chitinophagaceae bacterium]